MAWKPGLLGNIKATDAQIIRAYKKFGNIWIVGEKLNMCGQSVQQRLKKLQIPMNNPPFTPEEYDILRKKYILYRNSGNLGELSKIMGRTKQFLCRKAKKIGLTDPKHNKLYYGKWKYMEEDEAEILFKMFKKSRLGLNQFCEKHQLGKNGFYGAMKTYFADEWDHVIELKMPKQSKYRLGRQVEYAVRDKFKKFNYIVMRAPASKGPIDLIAIKKGLIVFIQCKRNMVMSVLEWNNFYKLSKTVDAIPLVAGRPAGRLQFWLMTGLKLTDGSKKKQPKKIINIEDLRCNE